MIYSYLWLSQLLLVIFGYFTLGYFWYSKLFFTILTYFNLSYFQLL
jgi:hypothetical protein